MPSFTLWGRTLNVDDSEFSTRSTFICRTKGKEASSFENVLASTDDGWTWDITERKKVSDWIGICPMGSEVMDLVEYVFVGTRT